MGAAVSYYASIEHLTDCVTCGVAIACPSKKAAILRERGHEFWCINGHKSHFAETENARLKKELEAAQRARDAAKARAEMAERSVVAYKGKVTEIKNRVGNGVCPCCKRTFKQLARHMSCKHPEYSKEGVK